MREVVGYVFELVCAVRCEEGANMLEVHPPWPHSGHLLLLVPMLEMNDSGARHFRTVPDVDSHVPDVCVGLDLDTERWKGRREEEGERLIAR